MERLGAHIRERRHELEFSQEEVAARAGLLPITVAVLERGGRLPSIAVLERVLDVLGEELTIGKSKPRNRARGQFDTT